MQWKKILASCESIYSKDPFLGKIEMIRDFVEISNVTYRKLDEVKVVTQPVKIIHTLDPFKPKIEGCE